MKKFLTISLSGIMLFCLMFSGVTALAENNFDMTVPDKNSYLYLETPVQIASDGDVVAILDDGLKKAVVSGPDEIRYVDCLDAFSYGKIWDMEFWNGNLFLLAEGEEFRLFCYDQGGNSVSPSWLGSVETPSAIAVRASELFVFDGYRTIYKINLETEQTSSFKCKKPLFAKHIAADENFVYALSYSGILSEISLSDGSVSESAFSVSDTLDLLSYGGNLYAVNAEGFYAKNGEKVFSANVLDSYAADGGFYLLDGSTTISLYGQNFERIREIGSSSNKAGKLRNPTDVAFSGETMAVADGGNNRLQIFDGDGNCVFIENTGKIAGLTWVAGTLYALAEDGGKLSAITNDGSGFGVRQTYRVSESISDIVSDGKRLYGYDLGSETLKIFSGGDFSGSVGKIVGAKKVKTSPVGKIFYYLTDDGVGSISAVGDTGVSLALEKEFGAVDFSVDAKGNLYVLGKEKEVRKYRRISGGYSLENSLTLENDRFSLDVVSAIEADGNGSLFVVSLSRHFVAKLTDNLGYDVEIGSYDDADLSGVTSSDDVFVSALLPCLMQKSKTDFELAEPTAGVDCVVFKGLSDEVYSYVLTSDGAFGYVPTSAISGEKADLIPRFTELKMLHTSGGDVYDYPLFSESAKQNSVGSTVKLKVIGSASGFHVGNHYWYEVEYEHGGKTYRGFVLRTRVVEFSYLDNLTVVQTAKIAGGIASSVNVYSLSDDKSEVLRTLTEGDRVELLEAYDPEKEYTLVRLNPIDGNECVGYVKTKYLTTDTGLTDGQIIGIVLAACCALVTVAVVLFAKKAKRAY